MLATPPARRYAGERYRSRHSIKLRKPARLYRAGAVAAGLLPAGSIGPLAQVAGTAAWLRGGERRRLVRRNMERAGDPSATRAAFVSYARYWLEALRLDWMPVAALDAGFSIEGLEHIAAERDKGRGVVLGLPHVGGWDAGGMWFVHRAFPMTVVAEVVEPPELFEWFVRLREEAGLSVVPLGPRAGVGVLRALRANEVVALLCDRDIDGNGIEVEFFGERTLLPAGPAAVALRAGCGLLPTAVYFDGDGHHAVVRPPIPFEPGGRARFADDTAALTQLLAHELESLIRRDPAQWHMFQPNWPSDPGYPPAGPRLGEGGQ